MLKGKSTAGSRVLANSTAGRLLFFVVLEYNNHRLCDEIDKVSFGEFIVEQRKAKL